LASEGAGFITGQRLVVDGGRSLGSWPPASARPACSPEMTRSRTRHA